MEIESKVVQQYRYLFNQISKMTEILMKHDTEERLLIESERISLIKIRSSEFRKLNQIIEKYPDVHEWYLENYRQDVNDT